MTVEHLPSQPTAKRPFENGRPPHLPCRKGDITEDVLLPGDPDRVALLKGLLDDVRDFGQRREFAVVTGTLGGHPLTLCSSGIGGPSAEIALVELAMLGAKRIVRIGGMSALVPTIPVGTYVSVERAVGNTSLAAMYRTKGDTPAHSDHDLAQALLASARQRGLAIRAGCVASTDSYYLGQDRPTSINLEANGSDLGSLDQFRVQGAIGVDMESQAILAIGQRLGLKTASLLGVHGNRATDEWLVDYETTQLELLHIAGSALANSSNPQTEKDLSDVR